jgi:hypothetical protein
MIEKPKKERRFLKALGRVGEILIQEVLIKVGSSLIKRIGGKKQIPSILFLFLSISLYGQFPININKQRLGFQTTADGLVWRGSLSDTSSIQPVSNQYAWVILDTVNLKLYSFDFTSNVWNQLPSGSTVDTTSLSNRINLKLNISDTAAMLLPYAKKSYVDTAGRFYARQDFTNVSSSTLTWTQTDTLVPAGVNVVQVYRNGQILLPTQYTIPTNASVVIGSTAFKLGENYTVIFPKGGGGSGSGGSGSLTSISGGTGISVSPNPITTTGTVSADLTVLMELSDTVTLSNRINNKVNISDTASMLLPYFRDADTSSLNLTSRFALKLNAADTASLSSRINTKGTVSSVASGFGLLGGTITTTGTLLLDSAVVFTRIRDSIVDVAIGNDTIKILKQEYAPALTSVLTWTITSKFPIQLKAYILVFRNGQLLNNDQYNLTDTNKITIVSTSFKVGANYTVATVSGIGSVGSAQGDPVYPEAGIAVSTGTTWTTSIPNNSNSWNIAFNDKINNAVFSGTDTKTLTLTQYDGGTFAPTFTDLQGVTGVTAGTGLTGGTISTTGTLAVDTSFLFTQSDTLSLNLTSRFAGKQNALGNASASVSGILTSTDWTTFNNKQPQLSGTGFVKASATTISYDNTSYLPLTGGTLSGNLSVLDSISIGSLSQYTGRFTRYLKTSNISPYIDLNIGSVGTIGTWRGRINFQTSYNTEDPTTAMTINEFGNINMNGTLGVSGAVTLSSTLAVTGNITEGGNNVLTNLDTASLSSRIDGKVSLTATETIGGTKTFNNLVNITNQMTISGSVSGANILLGKNTSNNGVGDITVGTGLSLASNILTATNPTEKYYFNLGIVAGAADNSNATYDFTYGSNVFIIPTSLNGYCIDSVYIRAVGCSTCPPVAGDKDYYVGVYKASAGNRITTSGATLVGSQITMNEYDLNEVNRNDTLTTGDVWWVYLNGTYTSDMAYITAGFLVKKTCN